MVIQHRHLWASADNGAMKQRKLSMAPEVDERLIRIKASAPRTMALSLATTFRQ